MDKNDLYKVRKTSRGLLQILGLFDARAAVASRALQLLVPLRSPLEKFRAGRQARRLAKQQERRDRAKGEHDGGSQ